MKYRGIKIDPCLNGFVCTIGCQTAVFETGTSLLKSLEKYLNDPEKMEKEYMEATWVKGPEAIANAPRTPYPSPAASS